MYTAISTNFTKGKNRCKTKSITKSYVILCTSDMMIVPIKADMNPYNNRRWFAGGTPQFFGGSSQGSDLLTMKNELREESQSTLELRSINGHVHSAGPSNGDVNKYNFFYSLTPEWQERGNGINWRNNVCLLSANQQLPGNEREMQKLVKVSRGLFDPQQDTDNDIIDRLLLETGTTQAAGINDFRGSHTAAAFVIFIKNIWPTL